MTSALTPKLALLMAVATEDRFADSRDNVSVMPLTVISIPIALPLFSMPVSVSKPAEIVRCSLASDETEMLLVPARALLVAAAMTAPCEVFWMSSVLKSRASFSSSGLVSRYQG